MTPDEATDFEQWAEELDIDDSPTVRVEVDISGGRRSAADIVATALMWLIFAASACVSVSVLAGLGYLIWWLVL